MRLRTVRTIRFACCAAAVFCFSSFLSTVAAQEAPISMRQVLTALETINSKEGELRKLHYEKLLKDVARRQVNFALTSEKEEDLRKEGANDQLIAVIRSNSPALPKPPPTPAPTPTPLDHAFLLARAETSFGKGLLNDAVVDYDRAIELKTDNASAYLGRGKAYDGLKAYDKAVADYDKAIQLDATQAMAFYYRGAAHERKENDELAIADYEKAIALDSTNEQATQALNRVRAKLVAKSSRTSPEVPTGAGKTGSVPLLMNMGDLSAYKIKLEPVVYPPLALQSRIEGLVVVEVSIDEKGNVVGTKAISGHQMLKRAAEDAARRSRFRPALFNGQPVKGFGTVTYEFKRR